MTLHHCFDAAYPPAVVPSHCDSVLGYIGGAKEYREWTLADWRRFSHLRQFPCWVPDVRGSSSPAAAGHAAAAKARSLGWVSSGGSRVIVCDLETVEAPSWYHAFATAVNDDGFYCVAYGSLSTVLKNRATNVWGAGYDGSQTLEGQHGHQYAANVRFDSTEVDYSVIDDWMYERGGVGPRR